MTALTYHDYLAAERLPHLWCPGCGHGIVLKALLGSLASLNVPCEKAVLATGIGCSGRAGDYVNFHRFQGTHGRTLAFATGMVLARPELTVVCLMGDGDCGAIGVGHLVHAARRNVNLTAVVANNYNYGMTGGQFSPLTPGAGLSSTSPRGKPEGMLDLCRLADTSGASFVARTTAYHVVELKKYLTRAIARRGFSLVEVLVPCPTYYGRYNQLGQAPQMLEALKNNTLPLDKYNQMDELARGGFDWRGVLTDREAPDFITRYRELEG